MAISTLTVFVVASLTMPLLLLSSSASAFVIREPDAPIAASGDNNVYVVWESNKTGNWEVLFRASSDGGKTFGDKINLSNNSPNDDDSFHPDVAAASSGDGDSNVYVSFHDNRTGNVETYVRASSDGGLTFGDAILIRGTGGQPQTANVIDTPGADSVEDSEENTRIAASDDNNGVYVVSWDKKTGNWEVFFARSTDNGQTFEETVNLSNTLDARSNRAQIVAADGGDNVYITWWETSRNGTSEPVFVASDDGGETFGQVLRLAADGPIGEVPAEETTALDSSNDNNNDLRIIQEEEEEEEEEDDDGGTNDSASQSSPDSEPSATSQEEDEREERQQEEEEREEEEVENNDCDPSYPDACIPSPPPDLDCGDISDNNFRVRSPDPHRFDNDNDGKGCES